MDYAGPSPMEDEQYIKRLERQRAEIKSLLADYHNHSLLPAVAVLEKIEEIIENDRPT